QIVRHRWMRKHAKVLQRQSRKPNNHCRSHRTLPAKEFPLNRVRPFCQRSPGQNVLPRPVRLLSVPLPFPRSLEPSSESSHVLPIVGNSSCLPPHAIIHGICATTDFVISHETLAD